jgi:hypothetical protein
MSELQNRIDDARVVADAIAYEEVPLPTEIRSEQSDDGDLLFEWYVDNRNLVCIWSRDHHISYSGLLDGKGFHGRSEHLEVLPEGGRDLLIGVTFKMQQVGKSEVQK